MSKDLWSKISQTIKTGAETLVQETKELTKMGRLKVELMTLENERNRKLQELGRKVYALYKVGAAFPPELAQDFQAVDETEKRIEETNREIEDLKAEDEAREAARLEEEKAKGETSGPKAYCSQCGAELRPTDVFCSQCGTKVAG
ncbi:MAG TPA: zinc-ribbon domain-containing protein [Firmicutes bacterium]|nr:zinc-ribbon domain-containing protein [Candidatus Fermentithermobacillaceae bacterium]